MSDDERVTHSKGPRHPSISGRPLAVDPEAETVQPGLPGFLARPAEAPVYHGFPVFDDVEVDGFKFGTVTDFEAEEEPTNGDAFVVAPDNSRAGLVWELSPESYVNEIIPPEPDRWGVWEVGFPHPMRTREDVRRNLEAVLPQLKEAWVLWRKQT
jgi:hypothetical protein